MHPSFKTAYNCSCPGSVSKRGKEKRWDWVDGDHIHKKQKLTCVEKETKEGFWPSSILEAPTTKNMGIFPQKFSILNLCPNPTPLQVGTGRLT